MKDNYTYPLDIDWSQAEMIKVMAMWQSLEGVYETGCLASDFLASHREFKTVVKSIGEERKLGRDFAELSGYSLYDAVKLAKKDPAAFIKMKGA